MAFTVEHFSPIRANCFRGSSWKEHQWLVGDAFEMHISDLVVVGVEGARWAPGACGAPLAGAVLQPWPLSHLES